MPLPDGVLCPRRNMDTEEKSPTPVIHDIKGLGEKLEKMSGRINQQDEALASIRAELADIATRLSLLESDGK